MQTLLLTVDMIQAELALSRAAVCAQRLKFWQKLLKRCTEPYPESSEMGMTGEKNQLERWLYSSSFHLSNKTGLVLALEHSGDVIKSGKKLLLSRQITYLNIWMFTEIKGSLCQLPWTLNQGYCGQIESLHVAEYLKLDENSVIPIQIAAVETEYNSPGIFLTVQQGDVLELCLVSSLEIANYMHFPVTLQSKPNHRCQIPQNKAWSVPHYLVDKKFLILTVTIRNSKPLSLRVSWPTKLSENTPLITHKIIQFSPAMYVGIVK